VAEHVDPRGRDEKRGMTVLNDEVRRVSPQPFMQRRGSILPVFGKRSWCGETILLQATAWRT